MASPSYVPMKPVISTVTTSVLLHLHYHIYVMLLRVNYFTFLTVPYLLSPQTSHSIAAGWNRNNLLHLFHYWDSLVAF